MEYREQEADPSLLDEDIPQDIRERRLHLRAHDYWLSLLDGRDFPSIADMKNADLEPFRDQSFLIDFPNGYDEAVLRYVGSSIMEACGSEDFQGRTAENIPRNSMLSRLLPHYMEVLANKAPIGFEAEFESGNGVETFYRGILLPLSDDNETIHFILGVINWKDEPVGKRSDQTGRTGQKDESRPEIPQEYDDGEAASPLYDLLAECRVVAGDLVHVDQRTRNALYDTLARAYGFFHAAEAEPGAYQEILEDAGIKQQARAPFTPVIKLIFGADYDKTRITEYATALCYAKREDKKPETIKEFIKSHEGGIKGCVKAERQARRTAKGNITADRLEAAREALRTLPPLAADADDWTSGEEEFSLILARRNGETGRLDAIKILDEKMSVLEPILKRTMSKTDPAIVRAGTKKA